ncbi:PTS sugar transporter subunit IIA [Bacillus sp. BRMEA1]|nr:PTS sugar transporter subunit IIA [Neobacillus endophyticus]
MKLTDLISLELIDTDVKGSSKESVIDEMIEKLEQSGGINSKRKFKKAILAREKESTTGIGFSIAIPHGKSKAVVKPSVVFGLKKSGVDWESYDGTPAKIIFMIAVPEDAAGNDHLKILQLLSRKLMNEEYRQQLLAVNTKEQAYELLGQIE